VIVQSSLLTGVEALYFSVELSANAESVAYSARLAIAANSTVMSLYTVSGSGANIVLTAKSPAENDTALNIITDNWSCEGLTTQSTSANTTAGVASDVRFKICDTTHHAVKSITQVYIDNGAGDGWQPVTHANEDLTAATFTLSASATRFKLGTSRVKVAFEGYHSGGTLIEGAPEIAEDLLLTWCGVPAADLDAPSFTASKTASACALNVPIEEKTTAINVINKICLSDCAYFSETTVGKLSYKTWAPYSGSTPAALTKDDVWDVSFRDDYASVFKEVRVGYSYQCADGVYLYESVSDSRCLARYQKNEVLTIDSYIRSQADANALSDQMLLQTQDALTHVTFTMSAAKVSVLIGDIFALTIRRSPAVNAGGQVDVLYEIMKKEMSAFPLKVNFVGRQMVLAA
jgi:hypothetical protein